METNVKRDYNRIFIIKLLVEYFDANVKIENVLTELDTLCKKYLVNYKGIHTDNGKIYIEYVEGDEIGLVEFSLGLYANIKYNNEDE